MKTEGAGCITDKQKDLYIYRLSQAEETIKSVQLCMDNHLFKDAINRLYYAAFYAVSFSFSRYGFQKT